MSSPGPLLLATALLATPFMQGAPSEPGYELLFAAEFDGSRWLQPVPADACAMISLEGAFHA